MQITRYIEQQNFIPNIVFVSSFYCHIVEPRVGEQHNVATTLFPPALYPSGQFVVKRRLNYVISTYMTFIQRCFNVV